MKGIDLSRTKLNDDKAASLSTCLHNVKVLNVSECDLTNNGIQSIAKAIEQKRTQVLTLLSRTIESSNESKFINMIGGSAKI